MNSRPPSPPVQPSNAERSNFYGRLDHDNVIRPPFSCASQHTAHRTSMLRTGAYDGCRCRSGQHVPSEPVPDVHRFTVISMQLTESTRKSLRQTALNRASRSNAITMLFMACAVLVFAAVTGIRSIPNFGPRLPAPLVFIVVAMIVAWIFARRAHHIGSRITRAQYRLLLMNLRRKRADDAQSRNRLLGR